MNRSEKEQLVSSLRSSLEKAELIVITRQSGLTAAEVASLRQKIREAGAKYKVVKNTLSKLAFEGTSCEGLRSNMQGPTAIAFSEDPLAAAKAVVAFAKENEKLEIVCGGFQGNILDAQSVKALASLPSLDELRGRLVGLLSAPATKVVRVLQAPAGQVARVFAAYGASGS